MSVQSRSLIHHSIHFYGFTLAVLSQKVTAFSQLERDKGGIKKS